jgi:hypothetical protein
MRQRGGDSEAQLQRRIATAIHEMGCLQELTVRRRQSSG